MYTVIFLMLFIQHAYSNIFPCFSSASAWPIVNATGGIDKRMVEICRHIIENTAKHFALNNKDSMTARVVHPRDHMPI